MALYSLLKLTALCALVHEAAAFAQLPPSECKEGDFCEPGNPAGACCSGELDPPLNCVLGASGGYSCQYSCQSMLGDFCNPGTGCVPGQDCCIQTDSLCPLLNCARDATGGYSCQYDP